MISSHIFTLKNPYSNFLIKNKRFCFIFWFSKVNHWQEKIIYSFVRGFYRCESPPASARDFLWEARPAWKVNACLVSLHIDGLPYDFLPFLPGTGKNSRTCHPICSLTGRAPRGETFSRRTSVRFNLRRLFDRFVCVAVCCWNVPVTNRKIVIHDKSKTFSHTPAANSQK